LTNCRATAHGNIWNPHASASSRRQHDVDTLSLTRKSDKRLRHLTAVPVALLILILPAAAAAAAATANTAVAF